MATASQTHDANDGLFAERRLNDPELLSQLQTITTAIFSREGEFEKIDDPEIPGYWNWMVWVSDSDADGKMEDRRRKWRIELRDLLGDLAHRVSLAAVPVE